MKRLFRVRSEKSKKENNINSSDSSTKRSHFTSDDNTNEASEGINDASKTIHNKEKKKGKNNGRLPASCYTGAARIEIKHPSLSSGEPCPLPLYTGRVYKIEPGNVIRIIGGKMAEAKRYLLEKLKCNLCGTLFSAELPKEAGKDKYDARFKATLAVHKYFLGLPFHRMERMQSYLGDPCQIAPNGC